MKSCLYCGLQSDHEAPLEHRRQLNIAIVLIHVKAKHEDNITHIALIVLMHSAAQLWKNHDTKELRRKKEEKLRDLEHISNQFMSFFFFLMKKYNWMEDPPAGMQRHREMKPCSSGIIINS